MSTKYSISGTIERIGEPETRGKFTCRKFVLTTEEDSEYPQLIELQLSNKNMDKIDGYSAGDSIVATFNIKGREWVKDGVSRFFITLDAWKIEGEKRARPATSSGSSNPTGHVGGGPGSRDDGDLPFLDCTNLDNTPPRMWRTTP